MARHQDGKRVKYDISKANIHTLGLLLRPYVIAQIPKTKYPNTWEPLHLHVRVYMNRVLPLDIRPGGHVLLFCISLLFRKMSSNSDSFSNDDGVMFPNGFGTLCK